MLLPGEVGSTAVTLARAKKRNNALVALLCGVAPAIFLSYLRAPDLRHWIVGLAIGVSSALGLSRFVESFLFGVQPNSPAALVLAVAILLSAVLVAGYVPARKASRIDPMTAVRHE